MIMNVATFYILLPINFNVASTITSAFVSSFFSFMLSWFSAALT